VFSVHGEVEEFFAFDDTATATDKVSCSAVTYSPLPGAVSMSSLTAERAAQADQRQQQHLNLRNDAASIAEMLGGSVREVGGAMPVAQALDRLWADVVPLFRPLLAAFAALQQHVPTSRQSSSASHSGWTADWSTADHHYHPRCGPYRDVPLLSQSGVARGCSGDLALSISTIDLGTDALPM